MPEMLSFASPLYSNSIQNPSREQARELLPSVFYASRKLAFEYAPLKHAQIVSLAGKAAGSSFKGASDFAKLISSTKHSQLEAGLSALVDVPQKGVAGEEDVLLAPAKKEKGSPVEFAFSLYFNCLLEKLFPPTVKFDSFPKPASEIRLAANFGGWMAVRKVNLQAAQKKEVVACSATIFESARKKLPEFLCAQAKQEEYNSLVEAFLAKFPERKSFSRVPEILLAAEKEEPALAALAEKGFDKPLLDAFYCRVLAQVGFPCFVSTDQVSRIYPDLKIPKPRGRVAGSGKKNKLSGGSEI